MVRATHPALYLTHARAFATGSQAHTGVASMAAREADGRREQLRERVSAGCVRPDGGGAGGGSSEAGRAYEGDGRDGVLTSRMRAARASTGLALDL